MKYIYLDSNILIAYYARDRAELEKGRMVLKALSYFANFPNVKLCTSMWTIAEMVNVLISNKKMEPSDVYMIENNFINERRLHGVKIELIEVSPTEDYDFQEFFYHVRQGVLRYHSGVGDIMHSVIMENNQIKSILTFDDKDDFKKIPRLEVIHPKIAEIEDE